MKSTLKLLMVIVSLGVAIPAAGQGNLGLGFRASPDGVGFTGKFFVSPHLALEAQANAGGIMGLEGESFHMVGLLLYHVPLPDNAWRLYFGGGFHLGVWDRPPHRVGRDWHRDEEAIFGIDGMAGIEYVFRNIPLGLSGDVKPAINFFEEVDFFPHNMLGFSVRWYLR